MDPIVFAKAFVVPILGLRRTAGAKKDFTLEGQFDEKVEAGLVSWPTGRCGAVGGSLEAVGDGVWVTGTISVEVDVQCSRCLTSFTHASVVEFQELFVYPERVEEYADEDVSVIDEDSIDLSQVVHDAVILDQSPIQLCQPDCLGLCQICGADLNTDPTHQHDDIIDSRWLSLREWGKMS